MTQPRMKVDQMNRYLEKIAKMSGDPEENLNQLGGAMAAGALVNTVGKSVGTLPFSIKLRKMEHEDDVFNHHFKGQNAKDITKAMLQHHGIDNVEVKSTGMRGFTSHFHPINKSILLDNHNPVVGLHEAGHALDFMKPNGEASRRKTYSLVGTSTIPRIGIAGAMLSNEKTSDYTAPVVAATYLPSLRAEFVASKNAHNYAKKMFGSDAAKYTKRVLGHAFGTYAAGATAGTLGAYAAQKYLKKLRSEND